MTMKDPWNPTAEDIRRWAKNNKFPPVQDWELALCDSPSIRLILELLEQKEVRHDKRTFLVRTLYVYAGDVFRLQKQRPEQLVQLQAIISSFLESEDLDVKAWVTQVQNVLDNSAMYRYETWGYGVKTLYQKHDYEQSRKKIAHW